MPSRAPDPSFVAEGVAWVGSSPATSRRKEVPLYGLEPAAFLDVHAKLEAGIADGQYSGHTGANRQLFAAYADAVRSAVRYGA